ncbi:MAG TPA: TVP38/TMEM64 family protein [Gammaproteobacteria bacterium]
MTLLLTRSRCPMYGACGTLLASLLLLSLPLWGGEATAIAERPLLAWLNGEPLYFLLAYVIAQQLLISSTAFCVAGGLLFGPVYGSLLSLLGATLGAALSFLISRHLLAGWLTPRLPAALLQVRDEVQREGWRAVAMIRLLPLLPYAPVNYTLGLTTLPLRQFLLPTSLLIAPRVAAYAYLGHSGRQALEGGLAVAWQLLGALGVVVALTWLPHLLQRSRR